MRRAAHFRFTLFVAGRSQNSAQAIANLRAICLEHLPDHHDITIVDVLREPARALEEGILVTPTLLRLAPGPVCRIIGNLSQRDLVMTTLGLSGATP